MNILSGKGKFKKKNYTKVITDLYEDKEE